MRFLFDRLSFLDFRGFEIRSGKTLDSRLIPGGYACSSTGGVDVAAYTLAGSVVGDCAKDCEQLVQQFQELLNNPAFEVHYFSSGQSLQPTVSIGGALSFRMTMQTRVILNDESDLSDKNWPGLVQRG
ncbi:hypothetical protein CCP3SC15_2610001 [Gammaproteobacteria bacterium]